MLRLFTMESDVDLCGILKILGVGLKVGKCTGTQKSCLEMGSYDTP